MRAIIIDDADARALLDQLKLTALQNAHHLRLNMTIDDMHRTFHYVVTRWLQEQGADVVR